MVNFMKKKFYLIISLIGVIFGLFIWRVISLAYINKEHYKEKYKEISEIYVEGSSAPRGRILDIKGRVIVDNVGVNEILYHKPQGITTLEEVDIAIELVKLTNYEYKYDEAKLKDYYLIIKLEEASNLITEEENELYQKRKLSSEDIYNLKRERITKEMLDKLTKEELYSSYFYYLMNDGYYYDNKILLKKIDDEVYARILEKKLPGIMGDFSWERTYPYQDSLKSVLGLVSTTLPKEKEYLLDKGYTLDDKVGISGLEEYYEEYLKGEKAVFQVVNNDLVLIKEAKRGNDLVLEIDMDIQLKVESIIKEEIKKAKKLANTEYYKESFALISEPLTGGVKALVGVRINDKGKFQDVSINVIKNAYTVGSVVKGASMAVGYQNKIIDIGTTMTDSCVKLANIPAKCSFKSLGSLNDIKALAMSSNYYQFIIALGVSGNKYKYNMNAKVKESDFKKYRDTFASFGLGTKTGIDLPNEASGMQGSIIAPDLLLNLAIGQYDLYTPVGMLQYINTIANNGTRLKLNLMHSINSDGNILRENTPQVLNKVNIEEKYMKRVQEGFREVIKSGTGYWYADPSIKGAGKTGTSESYIDSNYDGKLDAYVLSNTFIMYAPSDKPKYSLVVISPNVANLNAKNNYYAPVNRLIARKINDFLLWDD